MVNLDAWLKKVNNAPDSVAIFRVLDEFRHEEWSDEERAKMSKVYIAALARLKNVEFEPASGKVEDNGGLPSDPENLVGSLTVDEEVWYEKM